MAHETICRVRERALRGRQLRKRPNAYRLNQEIDRGNHGYRTHKRGRDDPLRVAHLSAGNHSHFKSRERIYKQQYGRGKLCIARRCSKCEPAPIAEPKPRCNEKHNWNQLSGGKEIIYSRRIADPHDVDGCERDGYRGEKHIPCCARCHTRPEIVCVSCQQVAVRGERTHSREPSQPSGLKTYDGAESFTRIEVRPSGIAEP